MVTRTTILRLTQVAAAGLLAAVISGEAHAQSLTIGGASSATSQPGVDFATSVLGDPWDFDQRTDWVSMYSANEAGASTFAGTPTQNGGVLSGVSSGSSPTVQLLYQGIDGALNGVGKSGFTTPIDASRFKRLSFRVRRSVGIPDNLDRVAANWFPNT